MSKIAIVIDSTANLPKAVLERYPIFVTPLQLIWGEKTFQDGVDIHPKEFYERLAVDSVSPTTSQPSPAVFKDLYSRLLNEGHEILSIHISHKLSGTMDSAIQAKAMLADAPIEIFDTLNTSMAMGFQVMAAARAAREGATIAECVAVLTKARQNSGVFFAVDTLEYLRRGGRIGGAAAFLGNVMDLKPILTVDDGVIEAADRVRTLSKATQRVIGIVDEKIQNIRNNGDLHIAVLHANAEQNANKLLESAKEHFGVQKGLIGDVSPVIGTHVGPGTVGLAYLADVEI
jgi:DegV family protein with EDD domain